MISRRSRDRVGPALMQGLHHRQCADRARVGQRRRCRSLHRALLASRRKSCVTSWRPLEGWGSNRSSKSPMKPRRPAHSTRAPPSSASTPAISTPSPWTSPRGAGARALPREGGGGAPLGAQDERRCRRARRSRADAGLIGEALMRCDDPSRLLAQLVTGAGEK